MNNNDQGIRKIVRKIKIIHRSFIWSPLINNFIHIFFLISWYFCLNAYFIIYSVVFLPSATAIAKGGIVLAEGDSEKWEDSVSEDIVGEYLILVGERKWVKVGSSGAPNGVENGY